MSDVDDLREFNTRVSTAERDSDDVAEAISSASRGLRRQRVDHDEPEVASKDKITVRDAQMWAMYGGNNYSACEKAVPLLPAGQYTVEHNNSIGIYFSKVTTNLDELIDLPDSVSEEVINDIAAFWTKEERFRSFGFLWKRGVLMWGPPGSGKTSTLQVIADQVINKGGVAIYVDNPDLAAKGLKQLRGVEPNRPLIIMLEDIDAIIEIHGESELLALMDGELQIDNVVFVATTNYPERLDKRFINRPSRFDVVKKIGMPSEKAREKFLREKCVRLADKANRQELLNWIKLSKGFSIAHLKELIVSVEVFEVKLEVAVERLKTMMDHSPKSSDGDGTFGFQ